jgi:glutamate-1-semialdehyde 2,1-aminomutase
LAGNPLAMRAGIATLSQLREAGLYHKIAERADRLVGGLRKALQDAGVKAQINSTGSLSTVFFTAEPVTDYAGARRADTKRYARFFREMLDRGILLAPSQFEAAFVSTMHTDRDIDITVAAARESLKAVSWDPTESPNRRAHHDA